MNPSMILTTYPCSISPNPTFLFSPPPLSLFHHHHYHYSRRRFYKISVTRSQTPQPSISLNPDVFGGNKELTGIQGLVESLSPSIRVAFSGVLFAGCLAAGYGLGFRFGGSRTAALGGSVAAGVVGAAAAFALNACVPQVAAASLHNYVAGCDDPAALKKEDIEAIAKRF
ncbi:hypothetical protein LIER_43085 [Lithospermum erythrorhizon]|uniref:Uncharacterized protein n=1 Tax=Lithospermum erythrorhizon TaxID=34254 RepID=A0AAV3PIL8_LITER